MDYRRFSTDGGGGALFTGGYDGTVRAFSSDGTEITNGRSQGGPIKCLSCRYEEGVVQVATGSMDQTLVTHSYSVGDGTLRLEGLYSGGHFDAVTSVSFLDGSHYMASGDGSGGLCLWKVPDVSSLGDEGTAPEETEGRDGSKKRRTNSSSSTSGTAATSNNITTITPTATWKAHTHTISGLSWSTATNPQKHLFSASWDYGLKVWDVERQDCLLTLNGSRVVSAFDKCVGAAGSSDVVATGHPDCTVRLWDMRVGGGKAGESKGVSESVFKPSHRAWVSAIKWSPNQPHVLATNSYDGCVKLWDIRSSLPLHTVRAHAKGDKGLCLAFGDDNCLFSGGSDCIVKKFSF